MIGVLKIDAGTVLLGWNEPHGTVAFTMFVAGEDDRPGPLTEKVASEAILDTILLAMDKDRYYRKAKRAPRDAESFRQFLRDIVFRWWRLGLEEG